MEKGKNMKWQRIVVIGIIAVILVVLGKVVIKNALNIPVPKFSCISYVPSAKWKEKFGIQVTEADLEKDLRKIKGVADCIRVYRARGVYEKVPYIAAKYNIDVIQGIWLDLDVETNEKEIESLKRILSDSKNIIEVVVGNEVLLFERLTASEFIQYIRRVQAMTQIPVVVTDVPSVRFSRDNNVVLLEADIVGIHIFPYWKERNITEAEAITKQDFENTKAQFPDKKIQLMEAGWPSAGFPNGEAKPSLESHLKYLDFLSENARNFSDSDLPPNIIEAFDQPIKMSDGSEGEGRTGAHWGIWDIWGIPKASAPALYTFFALASAILVFLMYLFFTDIRLLRTKIETTLWLGALAIIALFFLGAAGLFYEYVILLTSGMLLLSLQAITCGMTLWQMRQIKTAESYTLPARNFKTLKTEKTLVSIHIPCAKEDREILRNCIQSILNQSHKNNEILVGINNCDFSVYEDLVKHFAGFPEVRILNLGNLKGAKGQALNLLLNATSPDADCIAVLDSDYGAKSDWIENALAAMDASTEGNACAAVLFPQKYKKENENILQKASNLEFSLCFDFDAKARSKHNALLLHGTLCVIRKDVLLKVGGWPEDNICEDAELGIKILAAGNKIIFLDIPAGEGMAPVDFISFAKQHRRWAHGGMQTLRRMLKLYLLGPSFSFNQIKSYSLSWLGWILQAFLPVFFLGGVFGSIYIFYDNRWIPSIFIALFPLGFLFIAFFIFANVIRFKYGIPLRDCLRSFLVYAAVSPSIADGVVSGFLGLKRPFEITQKVIPGINRKKASSLSTYSKIVLVVTFLELGLVFYKRGFNLWELYIWAVFLLLLALPAIAEIYILFKEKR